MVSVFAKTGCSHFKKLHPVLSYLCRKESALCHAIEQDERQQDGDALCIRLILRIRAVALVLAQLQTARAGKHHKHDAEIPEQGGQPLPATQDVRGRTICRDWSF